jgi:hypothetical protein
MTKGYKDAKKVHKYISDRNNEKTIAEMMREELDKNLDISIFLDFVYQKIKYYASIQENNFKFKNNVCSNYFDESLKKIVQVSSKYSESDKNYIELIPTEYQHQKIIEQLIKDGFEIVRIYGSDHFSHKIIW